MPQMIRGLLIRLLRRWRERKLVYVFNATESNGKNATNLEDCKG